MAFTLNLELSEKKPPTTGAHLAQSLLGQQKYYMSSISMQFDRYGLPTLSNDERHSNFGASHPTLQCFTGEVQRAARR
jgi:hypothetical protein